ncbi:hypothetical protein [Paenibacillus sp. DYY-L-2]|uniref:hypothetical protein n=1 Tax=Paenibacillus sp. DYY-L-2 TaxID=3447013 RepID=UPI003F50B5DE
MKNNIKIVSAFLCGAVFFSGVSYAADNFLKAIPSKSKIIINGSETKFNDPIVSINDRLYIPLKEFTQKTGFSVTTGSTIQIEEYESLPKSKTHDGVEITLNSLEKNGDNVTLNITVKNKSTQSIKLELTGITADFNVQGRKYYTLGGQLYSFIPINDSFSYEVKRFLDDPIQQGEEITGDAKLSSSITAGTQNMRLDFQLYKNNIPTSISFYVDTKGVF